MVLTCPVSARAQATAGLSIQPGTELRVTCLANPEQRVRGRVVRLFGDTIVLQADDVTRQVALGDLAALEVRGGEDKRRGFMIGAAVTGVITAAIGGIDAGLGNANVGDVVGATLGNILLGGLVGYAFAPTGWVRIPLPISTARTTRAQQ